MWVIPVFGLAALLIAFGTKVAPKPRLPYIIMHPPAACLKVPALKNVILKMRAQKPISKAEMRAAMTASLNTEGCTAMSPVLLAIGTKKWGNGWYLRG